MAAFVFVGGWCAVSWALTTSGGWQPVEWMYRFGHADPNPCKAPLNQGKPV